ncbi:MAG: class I SAM-dependent methyltransferase [Bacteroidetes bacterium]|jgi:precorrin-6B methylase 2|nr:class I SAM-dependent methyltransferase [Bacteroidota bacterium]
MKTIVFYRFLIMLLILPFSHLLLSQETQTGTDYKPSRGQDGKDVIWIPTPERNVNNMLDLAGVNRNDFLIDLGSGDGRLVIEAARRGAEARGIEFNPDMVEYAKRNAVENGVSDKVEFIQGDLFEADLSEATVITMFLLNSINLRLRPKLLDLKPGTRIVSNTFDMEEWTPDSTVTMKEDCNDFCTALLWIIPARLNGTWFMNNGILVLDQTFQMFSGTLITLTDRFRFTDGKLQGDIFSFTHQEEVYYGRVINNTIEGFITRGSKCIHWEGKKLHD